MKHNRTAIKLKTQPKKDDHFKIFTFLSLSNVFRTLKAILVDLKRSRCRPVPGKLTHPLRGVQDRPLV
jgi:hypothetical protein